LSILQTTTPSGEKNYTSRLDRVYIHPKLISHINTIHKSHPEPATAPKLNQRKIKYFDSKSLDNEKFVDYLEQHWLVISKNHELNLGDNLKYFFDSLYNLNSQFKATHPDISDNNPIDVDFTAECDIPQCKSVNRITLPQEVNGINWPPFPTPNSHLSLSLAQILESISQLE